MKSIEYLMLGIAIGATSLFWLPISNNIMLIQAILGFALACVSIYKLNDE